MKFVKAGVIIIGMLVMIGCMAFVFGTSRFAVEGSAMEPNFHPGQYLIVSRMVYQGSSPQRGDVIVFRYPDNPSDTYLKRVIGLPGDTLAIKNGQVTINGQVIAEPYLAEEMEATMRGEWVVPPDSYFVMGDNRLHSSDSRAWGFLPRALIIGKAWITYWPPSSWGAVPQVSYGGISP